MGGSREVRDTPERLPTGVGVDRGWTPPMRSWPWPLPQVRAEGHGLDSAAFVTPRKNVASSSKGDPEASVSRNPAGPSHSAQSKGARTREPTVAGEGAPDRSSAESVGHRSSHSVAQSEKKRRAACRSPGSSAALEAHPGRSKDAQCEEMDRAQELKSRLNLSDILGGAALGDRMYAAQRFKPQDAAAAMKMTRCLRKAKLGL